MGERRKLLIASAVRGEGSTANGFTALIASRLEVSHTVTSFRRLNGKSIPPYRLWNPQARLSRGAS